VKGIPIFPKTGWEEIYHGGSTKGKFEDLENRSSKGKFVADLDRCGIGNPGSVESREVALRKGDHDEPGRVQFYFNVVPAYLCAAQTDDVSLFSANADLWTPSSKFAPSVIDDLYENIICLPGQISSIGNVSDKCFFRLDFN